jgi:hypothetical protein
MWSIAACVDKQSLLELSAQVRMMQAAAAAAAAN